MRLFKYSLLILGFAANCTQTSDPPEQPADVDHTVLRESRETAYRRADGRFERALFWSPNPDSIDGELRWMSPLIVEELDPLRAEDSAIEGFGRLSIDPSGRMTVEPDEPTVYHGTGNVEIGGMNFEQSTYLWFYPPPSLEGEVGWRGFRMVLDRRGYAIVWEVLSSAVELRVLYVSKPIEDAARLQYGSALPQRRWVVEPSVELRADLVVARIVGDGPQPMGPFVYLDYPGRHVLTLICRCEPSQVDLFPESRTYWLAELEQIEPAVRQFVDRVQQLDGGGSLGALRLPSRW